MSTSPVVQQTLDTKDAAKYLGVSVEFLKRARMKGNGPTFVKMGTRKVVYLISPTAHREAETAKAHRG